MHQRTAAAAVLIVAVSLAACGKKAAAISKASFAQQAQSACDEANFSIGALPSPGTDPAEQMVVLSEELTLYKDAFKKIAKLPEPAAQRGAIQAMLTKVNAANSLLGKEISEQQSGDTQGAYDMQSQVAAAGATANSALDGLGLVDCEES